MLQALRDDVIIQPLYEQKKGKIIIPDRAGKFKQYDGEVRGLVISVGSRYKYDVIPGDLVIWRRHEETKAFENGKLFLVIKSKFLEARLARE